jgi:hypothetical protein
VVAAEPHLTVVQAALEEQAEAVLVLIQEALLAHQVLLIQAAEVVLVAKHQEQFLPLAVQVAQA